MAVSLSFEDEARLLSLRWGSEDKSFLASVKELIWPTLPLKPCAAQQKDAVAALWMGSNEWSIISNE
ncbi:hypothetical protein [uncultured Cohaesibacter sp.]|uniref:hypothetical protein n=1 Tax=uncultured Cohaesibacter sp. TaxID=1002546 RepID=UPI002AA69825|nr:hypothetical protein [uncultured Cohaesibacter sp.]